MPDANLLWAIIALFFLWRGNNHKRRADRWFREYERIRRHDELTRKYDPREDESPTREDRVNTKLRDRCVSLEKQLLETQNELRKRDKMLTARPAKGAAA